LGRSLVKALLEMCRDSAVWNLERGSRLDSAEERDIAVSGLQELGLPSVMMLHNPQDHGSCEETIKCIL
jgi:hypothetical protein